MWPDDGVPAQAGSAVVSADAVIADVALADRVLAYGAIAHESDADSVIDDLEWTASELSRPSTVEHIGEFAFGKSLLDARMIMATTDLLGEAGTKALALKGFVSVDELTATQRRQWRAHTKAVARLELEMRLGCSSSEARHLVGVASAPVVIRRLVVDALERGEASWEQIRLYWRKAGPLPHEAAEVVAETLFGTEVAIAAVERLDAEGALTRQPWQAAEFVAALQREVVRAQGVDVAAERERRRAAYEARTAEIVVSDDGSAVLTVVGSTLSLCAVHQRLDRAARLLRGQGDPRTLAQLRSDCAAALLVHGTLPGVTAPASELPGLKRPPGQDELDGIDIPALDQLAQIVNAMPAIELQVVVPWDALSGAPALSGATPSASESSPHTRAPVGELLGAHPAFLSHGHLRELARLPGITLRRLLSDPADGRLIERGTTRYRPDAAMRRHVLAADVYSRGPGSRRPGQVCELDHVVPWAAGGLTRVSNLVALDKYVHQLKTAGLITSRLTPRRDLWWGSLLGQQRQTRSHDYRQYAPAGVAVSEGCRTTAGGSGQLPVLAAVERLVPTDAAARQRHPAERLDHWHRRDLLGQALYAALAHRRPGGDLEARDDLPGAVEYDGALTDWLRLTHTTPGGARRRGARPHHPTVAEVLGWEVPTPSQLKVTDAPWRQVPQTPPPF